MTSSSPGEPIAVWSPNLRLTHAQLTDDHLRLRSQIPHDGVVGLHTGDAALVAAALIGLEGHATEVRLIPPDVTPEPGLTLVRPQPGSIDSHAAPNGSTPTEWVLYTSGTTGAPKSISHTRESLARTVVAGAAAGDGFVWGLIYDPNRMAGLQVLLQGLLSGARIVAPPIDGSLASRISVMVDEGVNALSATPTMWRQLLRLPMSERLPLRQITLGGEIADQRILDSLATTFPDARIVHVFASTETGAAFSVRDGQAGFPLAYLDEPPHGVRLEIRDDILHVFSPGVSSAQSDGFASTGDIVEVVGDRLMFRGRASGVVNVGGSNVWPEVVETILRDHPDVSDAVVSAKPNPMTGNVLVAKVELTPGAGGDDMVKLLRSWVRGRAPRTHVPASVEIVEHLTTTTTGKVAR